MPPKKAKGASTAKRGIKSSAVSIVSSSNAAESDDSTATDSARENRDPNQNYVFNESDRISYKFVEEWSRNNRMMIRQSLSLLPSVAKDAMAWIAEMDARLAMVGKRQHGDAGPIIPPPASARKAPKRGYQLSSNKRISSGKRFRKTVKSPVPARKIVRIILSRIFQEKNRI